MSLRRPSPAPGASPHVADGIPPELLVRALAATSEISLITDAAQNILHASRSFSAITGYSEAEVLGTNCRILQGPGTAPEAAGTIRDALARGEQFRGDILNYRKDGSPFWNALTITPLLDEHGQVTHFVSVQRDINARMALHEQLRFQATHDQLTGLPNRAALDGHLAKALDPDGGSRPAVAVGLIDLDRFKEVNNALGHEAGDVILKSWAARMQARLQPAEFLARMGGDEFVLVVEGAAGDDAAALGGVLQRLGRSMDEPFEVSGELISLTMSAGLACSPRDGIDMRTLLRGADAALNVAKARGGERRAGGNWPGMRRTPARPAGSPAGRRTHPAGRPRRRTPPAMSVAALQGAAVRRRAGDVHAAGRGPRRRRRLPLRVPGPAAAGGRQPPAAGSVPPAPQRGGNRQAVPGGTGPGAGLPRGLGRAGTLRQGLRQHCAVHPAGPGLPALR